VQDVGPEEQLPVEWNLSMDKQNITHVILIYE
jgi:hypothetical protein